MSNTKKILKEIASSEVYKSLTDAVEQSDYDVIFDSFTAISESINKGKVNIEEGIESLPIRSRGEQIDKFRQSFDLSVERTLPLWHELNQALTKRQIMEGEVFGIGKKGDPLVRTPGGALVALRGAKLEEGSQVRYVVDYEGDKISIGRVFNLNPNTFYTVITHESREKIKQSLASIDNLLKSAQELLKEDSLSQLREIMVELEDIKNLPSTFKKEERERIIAQAQRYRNRLLYDIAVKSVFDFLNQQEEKEIEEFFKDNQGDKDKALSALGLFRHCTYEVADKLLQDEKPPEHGQSMSEIGDEIDSMESAMKLMDHRAAIDKAYPQAKSYVEKMKRLLDRLTRRIGQVVDALPEQGVVEIEAIQQAVKNTFSEEALFLELRKTFRSQQEYFSQRGAYTELIRKLGDGESIAAETAFRSYLGHKIPQIFAQK